MIHRGRARIETLENKVKEQENTIHSLKEKEVSFYNGSMQQQLENEKYYLESIVKELYIYCFVVNTNVMLTQCKEMIKKKDV